MFADLITDMFECMTIMRADFVSRIQIINDLDARQVLWQEFTAALFSSMRLHLNRLIRFSFGIVRGFCFLKLFHFIDQTQLTGRAFFTLRSEAFLDSEV